MAVGLKPNGIEFQTIGYLCLVMFDVNFVLANNIDWTLSVRHAVYYEANHEPIGQSDIYIDQV